MYFITTKRMLEVCFSVHPNIQYRTVFIWQIDLFKRVRDFCLFWLPRNSSNGTALTKHPCSHIIVYRNKSADGLCHSHLAFYGR